MKTFKEIEHMIHSLICVNYFITTSLMFSGTVIEVQQRIIQELKYQSSLELDESTYDRISSIPLAGKLLAMHAFHCLSIVWILMRSFTQNSLRE